jgi:hypothetical protein
MRTSGAVVNGLPGQLPMGELACARPSLRARHGYGIGFNNTARAASSSPILPAVR